MNFFELLWLAESSSHEIKNQADPSSLFSSQVEPQVKLKSGSNYRDLSRAKSSKAMAHVNAMAQWLTSMPSSEEGVAHGRVAEK